MIFIQTQHILKENYIGSQKCGVQQGFLLIIILFQMRDFKKMVIKT